MMMKTEQIEEKSKETQETENEAEKNRKKAQNVLSRSDSTGSGRKFLAPTLSDPQARNEKDRFNSSKKKQQRSQQNIKATLPNVNETTYGHHHHHHGLHMSEQQQSLSNHHVNLAFEVHDWWQEQMICAQSSDEES